MATVTTIVDTDEATRFRYAGILAKPAMQRLLAEARAYPGSYDRERVMMEADSILDHALDTAERATAATKRSRECVVCSGHGCEFCPKA